MVEAWKVRLKWLPVALVGLAIALGAAQANFAATEGFSGRFGATCIACHTLAPTPSEPATAVLEGLPAAWEANTTYELTIRVLGGPPALPAPAPQGGFEIGTNSGFFSQPDAMKDLLRQPDPDEVTYEPAGSLRREWQVLWHAPAADQPPEDAGFWLSVVAANGNHVIATNASDGGERFDQVDSIVVTVPPSAATLEAWVAFPLAPPTVTAPTRADGTWVVEGAHADPNATVLGYRVDGAAWANRTTGTAWRITLPDDGQAHDLEVRSEGGARRSPPVPVLLPAASAAADPAHATGPTDEPGADTPLGVWVALAALAITLLAVARRPRP